MVGGAANTFVNAALAKSSSSSDETLALLIAGSITADIWVLYNKGVSMTL